MRSLLLILLLTTSTLLAQSRKPINIESVRADLLSKSHIVPEDVIKSLKPAMFNVMYSQNLCFVHVRHKSYAGEPAMQASDLIVYRLSNNNWTYETLLQTWYNLELLDSAYLVFLTDVKFCEPNGDCKTYKAVSHYDGRSMVPLREYPGFDKTLYYNGLLSTGKTEEVKSAIGQKILESYNLYNFKVEQHQTSFTLKHRVATLSSFSKEDVKTKVTLDNMQRVIVNH